MHRFRYALAGLLALACATPAAAAIDPSSVLTVVEPRSGLDLQPQPGRLRQARQCVVLRSRDGADVAVLFARGVAPMVDDHSQVIGIRDASGREARFGKKTVLRGARIGAEPGEIAEGSAVAHDCPGDYLYVEGIQADR